MAEDYTNWYRWYEGTPSTFEPGYTDLFSGYKMSAERLGDTTNPATANQIAEVGAKLRQGMKTIEMGVISPDLFETIPKQHFKKLADLAKLTGAEISIHAPMNPNIDTVGFGEREGWSESNRQEAERRLLNLVEKSHDINPKGNVPVTIHATMVQTGEWKGDERESIGVIDPESGSFGTIKAREHLLPGMDKPKKYSLKDEIDTLNSSTWANQLTEVESQKREIDTFLRNAVDDLKKVDNKVMENAAKKWNEGIQNGIKDKEELRNLLTEREKSELSKKEDAVSRIATAREAMRNEISAAFSTLMTKAYRDEKYRDKLIEIGKEFNKDTIKSNELLEKGNIVESAILLNNAQSEMINAFNHSKPETYQPITDFAKEKASTTIGNVALKAFKEFGDTAPIIAVENVYPNVAFARGNELRDMIEESRKKFVSEAVKQGIGESKAKDAAKKLIGATWDIAHINMLKGKGIKEETLLKDTKIIAPYIKKVHLSDNFGFGDTHLAPGMANTAVKEHMKEIEKVGFRGKAIAEMGGLHQQFKVPSAYGYALEAMGSPMYAAEMASYWARAPSRYSLVPPEGGGFAPIPSELGGSTQKKQYTTQ